MRGVFLSLGTNMGHRETMLIRALVELEKVPATRVLRCSSLYETTPWGKEDQQEFMNIAVEIETEKTPGEMLAACERIEQNMGRSNKGGEGKERWGPRRIDIDILLWGEEKLEEETLVIPHPHLTERRFVLVPLAEIAPHRRDPITGKTIEELLRECRDKEEAVKVAKFSAACSPATPVEKDLADRLSDTSAS